MKTFEIQIVDVRYLYRHGYLIAVGLSDEELYEVAPSLKDDQEKQILIKSERVGIVRGEVFDWSKHGGHSFNPKIHWDCPNCGQQWFTDFSGTKRNPILEGSGCKCVSYWLVHWDEQQVKRELAK